jgi:nitrate/TMAO reductase-like tetraheme cytochrome c subunit
MCAGCHGTHGVRPAASLGVAACATCHRTEVATYRESVHGRSQARGASEAATCRSCHGAAHGVLAAADNRAPTYHLNLPRTCAQCHASPELARRHDIPVGDVYKLYLDSIHGRALTRSGLMVAANCSDCHGVHDIRPAADPASKVFRSSIPRTCGTCHAGVLAAYAGSIHGQQVAGGNAGAPVCTSCHTAHQIRRVEAAPWQLEVIRECGTCHEESLKTYRDSFHGKVTSLGLARVAKCADCHGAHAIVPAADPRSTVAPEHIVATCRQCHPQANASFAQFHPHADPADKVRFPRLYYAYVTMNGLLASVFGFFGLHTLLWLPRSLAERWRRRRGGYGGEPPE